MNNTDNLITNPKGIADCLEFFVLPAGEQGAAANAVRSAIAFLRALEPTADVTLPMGNDGELVHELVHTANDDGHADRLMMSDSTRRARDAMLLRLTTWRAAMQEFVDRVERGEVASRYTYGKFKALLACDPLPSPFPERDPSKPAEAQGLFRKFDVRRLDGKNPGAAYFVIDMDNDEHAGEALLAYSMSCARTHPKLAAELHMRFVPVALPQTGEPVALRLNGYSFTGNNSYLMSDGTVKTMPLEEVKWATRPAMTPNDAAEVERFRASLQDTSTMAPRDLVAKHADYMGISAQQLVTRNMPKTAAGLDLDSDEPVKACGIGMGAGEACESCQ
jgi:hypothetical protein